jgi:hypothetical protein
MVFHLRIKLSELARILKKGVQLEVRGEKIFMKI